MISALRINQPCSIYVYENGISHIKKLNKENDELFIYNHIQIKNLFGRCIISGLCNYYKSNKDYKTIYGVKEDEIQKNIDKILSDHKELTKDVISVSEQCSYTSPYYKNNYKTYKIEIVLPNNKIYINTKKFRLDCINYIYYE